MLDVVSLVALLSDFNLATSHETRDMNKLAQSPHILFKLYYQL